MVAIPNIKKEEEKKEYFDSPEEIEEKATKLAQMIREANNIVFFTGAGISTSTGISDYRSGEKTVLDVGPGCWEKQDLIRKWKEDRTNAGKALPLAMTRGFNTAIIAAKPSPTHMALVELQNRGKNIHVISQNIDGLHRKSGMKPENMSELHGNTNLEICKKCKTEHMRDFKVRCATKQNQHDTGRKCEKKGCDGDLKDSIINYGDSLEGHIIEQASRKSAEADLYICMGSSMRVSPANMLPTFCTWNGGKVVMMNLQKTPYDMLTDDGGLLIHSLIDPVMDKVMNKLGWPIPEFRRTYRLRVDMKSADNKSMNVYGVDGNGCNYVLFKELKLTGFNTSAVTYDKIRCQRQPLQHVAQKTNGAEFKVHMQFYGHYHEPNLEVTVPMAKLLEARSLEIEMLYNVQSKTWEAVKLVKANADRDELGAAQFRSIAFDYSAEERLNRPAAQTRVNALGGGAAANRASSQKRTNQRAGAAAANSTHIDRIKNTR